jgi:LCP family protein required for cell wall assembly
MANKFNMKKALILAIILSIGLLGYLLFKNPIVSNFAFAPVEKIKSDNGRVNVLIMGKAGENHAGGDLTDTMILASLALNDPKIALISIPRDLWIPEIRAKVNSAYYWGNQRETGGLDLAKSTVSGVLGQPVHYGIVMDFSGFKDIVDVLGGIEVNVENTFTDPMYPIAGRENDLCAGDPEFKCRYESITFTKGTQMMDGATALKFVRSRHAEGTEGTDIAREARQQKVIDAIKNKVLNPVTFLNPKKDTAIWNVVMSSLETDIDSKGGAVLARKAIDGSKSINKYLIPEDLLLNPPISPMYDKQYVFIPKKGNGKWEEIQLWVKKTL